MLSDRQRSIVALIDRLGVDHEDIAEELDLSPSTVRDTITRMCLRYQCRPAQLPGKVCLHCGADVFWSMPRKTDPCLECGKPVGLTSEAGEA